MSKTVVDAEQYEDLVRRSGLVEKDQLDKVINEVIEEQGGKLTDTKALAQRLMDAKLITSWQNDKLIQGRHRGFFLGKYKLLSHISKGGMSEVYLAEQVMMRRRVAIKIFPPELIEKSSYLARFYQESRVQAAMDHPNIVKAHDFGNEGKIHYLVMEYVDGLDLNQFVERKGPLPFRLAAKFIMQAADALQYAHQEGMIHRDIKPANLMLDRSGTIKLLDLGLARVLDGDQGSLTLKHNENTLGTADYVAPEQAVDSHHIDERADIYSLGGTFYYLLTGHPPFPEGTPVQRMMMHMNQDPDPIANDRPETPPQLITICEKMMAKKPDDRYRTAQEVVDLLQDWLDQDKNKTNIQETPPPDQSADETSSLSISTQGMETITNSQQDTPRTLDSPPAEASAPGAPLIQVEEKSAAETYQKKSRTNVGQLIGEVIYATAIGAVTGVALHYAGQANLLEMSAAYGAGIGAAFGILRAAIGLFTGKQ